MVSTNYSSSSPNSTNYGRSINGPQLLFEDGVGVLFEDSVGFLMEELGNFSTNYSKSSTNSTNYS